MPLQEEANRIYYIIAERRFTVRYPKHKKYSDRVNTKHIQNYQIKVGDEKASAKVMHINWKSGQIK